MRMASACARCFTVVLSMMNGVTFGITHAASSRRYAGINAQGYVSATTFMVLSNLNKFVVVAFGIVVLREASSWQVAAFLFRPRGRMH